MDCRRIAILGAGPKAISIAIKNRVLREMGLQVPKIMIIEKHALAYHWSAESGLTSGHQPLGTSAEKDVGFPYESFAWGSKLNHQINLEMQRYSWQSFLIAKHRYSDWIDRGKPAPHHMRWREYLHWVFEHVQGDVEWISGELSSLTLDGKKWKLDIKGISNASVDVPRADALIVTGPGDLTPPSHIPKHERIVSTQQFWRQWRNFSGLDRARIAIVGTGETAASVTVGLAQSCQNSEIDVISSLAMNYTRGESYAENHIYTDPFQGNWFDLTFADRRAFVARTDRGVFSVGTKKILDHCENVAIVPGRTDKISVDSLDQIVVEIAYSGRTENRIYDYVIWAAGFDHFAMLNRLLNEEAKEKIIAHSLLKQWCIECLEESIDENLAVKNLQPWLHLPMMSGLMQGPGFANLSCLGRMADHILSCHVQGVEPSLY